MFFTAIKPDRHYIEVHRKEIPWHKVVEIIFAAKNKRKKGRNIEIKTDKYYLLCKLKNNILWVINAKLKK